MRYPGRGEAAGWGNAPRAGGLAAIGGGTDLLGGAEIAVSREGGGGTVSVWSRQARSGFAGRDEGLGLEGDVRTTLVGADYARGRMVAGVSMAHSRGLGEFAGRAAGEVLSSVTGLYPWIGYRASDRVTLWGVGGYGAGGLMLAPARGRPHRSGLTMRMGAAGTRGELAGSATAGFAGALKADALWVSTAIDGSDGAAGRLAGSAATVSRLRTGIEAARTYSARGRLSVRPTIELGLRHDGGDAETGAGIDVGAGVIVADAGTGLAVDVQVRRLIMHQAEGFEEHGLAVSVSYDPSPGSELGLTARIAPSWGRKQQGEQPRCGDAKR